jgi:hypothetical protein
VGGEQPRDADPQHTLMAVARLAAEKTAEGVSRRASA